jgi:hypothetical protein
VRFPQREEPSVTILTAEQMDEARLNALLQAYLAGAALPRNVRVQLTSEGPEVVLEMPPASHRWLRRQRSESEVWIKTLILG